MNDLTSIWNPSNCLTQKQLMLYLQQKLEREETYVVETHINDCELCNDALEGLMNQKSDNLEQIIDEINTHLNKKLPTKLKATKNSETKVHNTLKQEKNTKFRWLYAASILLIVGLGYSVFSFITKYKPKENIVQHTDNPNLNPDESTYKPLKDSSGEVINLQTTPEEVNDLKNTPLSSEKNNSELNELETKEDKKLATANNPQSTADVQNSDLNNLDKPNLDINVQKNIPKQSERDIARTQIEDEKIEENKLISKKKSTSYGLSKEASAPQTQAPAVNQLNYSSNQNTKEEMAKTTSSKVASINDTNEDISSIKSMVDKGQYKKAIRQLNKLKDTHQTYNQDEFNYYLAICYYHQKDFKLAEANFNKVKNTPNFGTSATQYLQEIEKKQLSK